VSPVAALAALAIAGPALLPVGMIALNALVWPRGRPRPAAAPTVSVLIPARNEERAIGAALDALRAATGPILEIIVYDDGSTDATPRILAEKAAADPRVRVLSGVPLPPGWVGKPHACHRLGEAARGEVLLFLDADVRLAPDGLRRVLDLLAAAPDGRETALVTAVPRQRTGTFAEALLLPLLHLVYLAWLPTPLVRRSADPRFLAANGQVLAVRRSAYAAIGGFAAVRAEVVDDMAFCRRAKVLGLPVLFADGHRLADCRMYEGFGQVWRGFSKNLYEGVGGHPAGLFFVVALLFWSFVLPYLALAAALPLHAATGGTPLAASLLLGGVVGVGANLAARGLLAARHRHGLAAVLLHPVAVLVLIGIAINSFRWSRAGRIAWAGRTYAARPHRSAP
jgi:glycosyltransferase involved in cell wall biosynthesis